MFVSGLSSVTATKWLLNYYLSKLGSVNSRNPFIVKYTLIHTVLQCSRFLKKSCPQLMQSLSEGPMTSPAVAQQRGEDGLPVSYKHGHYPKFIISLSSNNQSTYIHMSLRIHEVWPIYQSRF